MKSMFERKVLLISGGTGSFGNAVLKRFLDTDIAEIRIFSRDEKKQDDMRKHYASPKLKFYIGDVRDYQSILNATRGVDYIFHAAALKQVPSCEFHPMEAVKTNVLGTAILLNASRKYWQGNMEGKLFYHVSTDEVYGTLGAEGFFTEETAYDPRSPYSASKASSDHFVMAYHHTYHMPVIISNCSNNYGSHHFPEKLIPLAISNIRQNKPVPVYGKGENVRDWLWVEDHARAIDTIFHKGRIGETYNIGGINEWKNIDLINLLCMIMDKKLGRAPGTSAQLITFVKDRAGHDLRYAIDATKLKNELGWVPSITFEEGLEKTVDWYLTNEEWLNNVTSGHYQQYYEEQYHKR